MALRKVTTDNSVRYVSNDEYSHTEQTPPISNTRKKNASNSLSAFDHFKSEILVEPKRVKYHDLDDLVYRMELLYDEIMDVLDIR